MSFLCHRRPFFHYWGDQLWPAFDHFQIIFSLFLSVDHAEDFEQMAVSVVEVIWWKQSSYLVLWHLCSFFPSPNTYYVRWLGFGWCLFFCFVCFEWLRVWIRPAYSQPNTLRILTHFLYWEYKIHWRINSTEPWSQIFCHVGVNHFGFPFFACSVFYQKGPAGIKIKPALRAVSKKCVKLSWFCYILLSKERFLFCHWNGDVSIL